MYFNLSYFNENNKPCEVQVICDKCGKYITINDMSMFKTVQSEYCITDNGNIIKCECGNEGNGRIEFKKNPSYNDIIVKKHNTSYNMPKCPTCSSTNLRKVSGSSKAISVAMWGLLSQKVKKTWHCENCGYEW